LDAGNTNGRAFGEATDELVEEILCADLKVESIAAVLDANVKQSQGEHGHVRIAVVDILDNGDGGFARSVSLLSIDQVGNLEVEGQVWFEVLRVAGGI
jgi:hypothetical protein